jgi:CBS domain-containing protein
MSIEQDLQAEKVTALDLSEFVTVESGTSIRGTVARMRARGCNCAFITRDGRLAGIFTDRDLLRSVVDRPEIWDHGIDEVMTHDPQTIHADQTAGDALKLMEAHHFRNTPVIDDRGAIVGNLTHFAVIRYLAESFPQEVLNLPPEPDVFGEERFGG